MDDKFEYAIFGLALVVFLFPNEWFNRKSNSIAKAVAKLLVIILFLITSYVLAGLALWTAIKFPEIDALWQFATSNRRWMLTFGIMLSVGLFYLRKYCRWFYGAIEISVGLLALGHFNTEPSHDLIPWIVLYAGPIYVIIRGLDNFDRGISDRLRSRFWWLGRKPSG